MRIAVLPFSTSEGVSAAIGRQFSNFATEVLRGTEGIDIGAVTYLAEIAGQPGKVGYLNVGDSLIEPEQVKGLIEQGKMDLLIDGTLNKTEHDMFTLVVRFHHAENLEAPVNDSHLFKKANLFEGLHWLVKRVAQEAEIELPEAIAGDTMEFGTENPEAAMNHLMAVDANNYIQQAKGNVANEFDPAITIRYLFDAMELDPDFDGPYTTLLDFCAACAQHRIGKFVDLENALKKAAEIHPKDYRAWYALAEIHMMINEPGEAATFYEKAVQIEPEEAALYTRLGIAQMNAGMPVNAERNFKKAMEMEGPDKPSTDFLSGVLTQTGRAHEIPPLWKSILDEDPTNPNAHAKYAISLYQNERKEESEMAFEHAIATLEDNLLIKRYYAPVLVEKGEVDRAMDFYEDCLDATPTDIPLMIEYAQTLHKADRDFEIPPVLRNIIAANADPNTKAQTMAWLIELEQPKRMETIEAANKKMEAGEFEEAVRELKPLRNWLADYWKLWAMLAAAYNRLGQHDEAEDASRRLIKLFPGFEPGYAEILQALTQQGKHDEAYKAMRYAAMNIPNSFGVHVNLGLAAKRAGHEEEARAVAKQIRETAGNNEQLVPVLAELEA